MVVTMECGKTIKINRCDKVDIRKTSGGKWMLCTATGNSGHSLNQDCGILTIYLKGVSDGKTKTQKLHPRV